MWRNGCYFLSNVKNAVYVMKPENTSRSKSPKLEQPALPFSSCSSKICRYVARPVCSVYSSIVEALNIRDSTRNTANTIYL
jgi:hypothetical protein